MQQSCSTLCCNFVAQQSCLSDIASRVDQLLMSRVTEMLDRNHLYSSAISRSVAELWLVNYCLLTCQLLIFVTVSFVDNSDKAISKALLIFMSSLSVSLEAVFVWHCKTDSCPDNFVEQQSCTTTKLLNFAACLTMALVNTVLCHSHHVLLSTEWVNENETPAQYWVLALGLVDLDSLRLTHSCLLKDEDLPVGWFWYHLPKFLFSF